LSLGILDSIMGLFSENTKKGTCSKCGKLIVMSKSTIVIEAKDYGYCPVCRKLFCKKCASLATLTEDNSPLECVTCNARLKGNL
ncbi:MAG: hypothetical protein ABRQ39_29250, partial [Candidatus Eremiobacterota bacterium]